MIYLATATITPVLERTLTHALARTTDPATYRLLVLRGAGSHGEKLDRALAWLPADAEWLGTLDDDAAPLAPGWLPWFLGRIGTRPAGGIDATLCGTPHPAGALYRVAWLRDLRASFRPFVDAEGRHHDVGAGFGLDAASVILPSLPSAVRPWWLRRLGDGVVGTACGQPMLAHLGGGTIGSTSWRMPPWLWARAVRWHLRGKLHRPPVRIVIEHPAPRRALTVRRLVRETTGR